MLTKLQQPSIEDKIESILFDYERNSNEFNIHFKELVKSVSKEYPEEVVCKLFELEEIHNKDKKMLIAKVLNSII